MIQLTYPNHGLSTTEIQSTDHKLPEFLQKIHARQQGFYEILDDKETLTKVENYANTHKNNFDHFIILGIGGSALGPLCIQQTFGHLFQPSKLQVLDNIDPTMIAEITDAITIEKTLFIVITKSGETPETLSQYHYFRALTDTKNLDPKNHFLFITDPKKGQLRQIAQTENIQTFEIPQNVGGRFSVLTPVGLLPAALLGLNIRALIQGAKTQREKFLSENPQENDAYKLATIQHLLNQKGKNINILMPYAQKLFRFADWYRQLLAESTGKENKGLTPINALGATDQHSQTQLYNEGPNDKLIIFLELEKFAQDIAIDEKITFGKLLNIELEATRQAYTKNHRPNLTIKLDSISEENLGALFMLMQGATAFLGEFLSVNAFDQPGVELSKQITKELLAKL